MASLTTNIGEQIFTQGVVVGIGLSCIYFPAMSVVPQWFVKYRATGVSLASLGAGLGNLAFALGGEEIITTLGWRNTLRVLGGIGIVLLLFASTLLQRRFPPVKKGGIFTTALDLIHVSSYRWFLLMAFLFQWGFFVPFVQLGAYANDLKIPPTGQGLAVAMLGIGSSVGRVTIGPIGDLFGRMNMFRVCMFFAAVSLACWPVCTTLSSILVFAFFYSFFAGGFAAQAPVIAGDLWGVHRLGGTFSFMNIVMIPGGLASGPIAGLIFQTYGSYNAAIWGASVFLFLSSVCLVFIRKSKEKQTDQLPIEHIAAVADDTVVDRVE